jgi:predicted dehydrogenase
MPRLETADFAAAVLDGIAPQVPTTDAGKSQPEHSLGDMQTALALYRSTESDRWEPVW